MSLYQFSCLAHGAALAAGAEEEVEAPSDEEHDQLLAFFNLLPKE